MSQRKILRNLRFTMMICFLLNLIFLILLSNTFGWALETNNDLTDMSIEDLMNMTVIGASKFEQKVSKAPSSVTIITSDEIEKYGYRTLADILRSVRSFYVNYDRSYHYIGIRGFSRPGDYNSRILLLVDGVRQNDAIFNQAAIGTDFILDADLIERVEIIRGPGSSLYGSNAFFAVINVITKKVSDLQGLELSGDAGEFQTYKGRISYGNRFKNNAEVLLSASYYESDGDDRLYYEEFDAPETNNGIAEDSDRDRFHSFFGKVSFHDFTLEGAFVSRKKNVPTAAYETVFNDNHSFIKDERAFIDLKYEHRFPHEWDAVARVSYSWYDYDGDYPYEEGEEEPYVIVNKDSADSDWLGAEAQVSKVLFDKHKVIFGGEYRYNFSEDQKNYDEEIYLDSKEDSTIWGLYIQDEFPVFSNLLLNAGIRHDHYSTFGGTTNPRLALIYNPFEKTVLKILYGSAFRAPNAYELYYEDGSTQKPNPDIEPETIYTYELVIEQQIGEHLKGTINGFYYKIDDLIDSVLDSDDLLQYKNTGGAEAKGVEVELEGVWSAGLRGRLSYVYQRTEDDKTGERLTNSPEHLAKLNLVIPLVQKKLFLGFEEQYTGKRKTLVGKNADDYFITNVTLFNQDFLKGLRMSASVYNLFNEKYSDPGSSEHLQDVIGQDGRSFRVKLTYAF